MLSSYIFVKSKSSSLPRTVYFFLNVKYFLLRKRKNSYARWVGHEHGRKYVCGADHLIFLKISGAKEEKGGAALAFGMWI